jgi:N-acetylated-alpha-linked acidic dipeptidase
MSLARLAIVLAAATATGGATAGLMARPDQERGSREAALFGFTAASGDAERQLERRFLALPSADRAREYHRFLTSVPHVAGSDRNRALAEWMRDRWKDYGIDDVSIVEYEVLLPWPEEVSVEIAAQSWKARLVEDPIPGDPDTVTGVLHYHAYSQSGDIEAPIVYAASGNPENYDYLASRGIDVRGKIMLVRYSVPYSYRGFKALTAERRGAAGILIYSDPAEDGAGKGAVYPDGPWGNESHLQSGGIPYDFLVPGDPLTPGWASVPGARRIPKEEAISLPKIVSAPLSARDARVLLNTMEGADAPSEWQGGLGIKYRVGPGAAVRLRVKLDDKVRPIQTVIGRIRGAALPDEQVILGNHRDAWIYGGVDPSSGTASMMDLARSLGALVRAGIRPRRSIVLASWDAEEFTLTSSTEWGEQNEEALRENAVAYLNVDSSTSGPSFTATAVPSLNQFIAEAAAAITDPATGLPLPEAKRREHEREAGSLPNASGRALVNNRLGSGSDYTVFLNFIGVPIVDMAFDGPYGVYHSQYDNHQWVERIGDPGFRYHEAMTKLWGVMALRLANADTLPFDYRPYAANVKEFAAELEKRRNDFRGGAASAASGGGASAVSGGGASPVSGGGASAPPAQSSPSSDASVVFAPLQESIARFEKAAEDAAASQARALSSGDAAAISAVNRRLMRTERAFLDPAGIPGRPWYRHQIYAPKFTYAPELLPSIAEAIDARDAARVADAVKQVAAAIDRAAAALVGN